MEFKTVEVIVIFYYGPNLNPPPNNGSRKSSGTKPSSRESERIRRSETMFVNHNSSGEVSLVIQPDPQDLFW